MSKKPPSFTEHKKKASKKEVVRIAELELSTNYLDPISLLKFLDAIPRMDCYTKPRIKNFNEPAMPAPIMQLFFQVCYYCALRVSECINLERGDIDLEHRILRVQRGKTGNNQLTSIPKPLLPKLESYLEVCPVRLFDLSRVTAWKYSKEAGKLAGLKIFEQQDKREINGLWTHAFRKAYAKWMYNEDAKTALIDVKLRHRKPKTKDMADSTYTYIKPDINALIKWEDEHF